MPRNLLVGNGSMLATFGSDLQMRDFYFPYIGMEDQTQYDHIHRFGVFVEGVGMRWLDHDSWQIDVNYAKDTLLGNSKAYNPELGITLHMSDFVHPVFNILVRKAHIESDSSESRIVKLFFEHDLHIYGDKQKDTAFYEPRSNTVIHYRENRYFLIGGDCSPLITDPKVEYKDTDQSMITHDDHLLCTLSEYTVGKIGYKGLEGTWKDAEDGYLSMQPVEQGSVDSTVGLYTKVSKLEPATCSMWLCAGRNLQDVLNLHSHVLKETPKRLERNCYNYWKSWVNKNETNFEGLKEEHIDMYKRSLMTVRSLCDNNGGIIAAADSDIMEFNKDTYTYVWPRDGAFVSLALDNAGYHEITRRFFEFCTRTQMPEGYMLHKYNPDGSLGSSWHPWYKDGEIQLPIQEDETALVLYSLYKHFEKVKDFEFLQYMYESFLKKAAEFLLQFTESPSGLPLPSYDLWEEQRGVFTYTTACTIAGLDAAAKITHVLGHFTHSERYQQAADTMRQAMLFHLYDEQTGRFVKKIVRRNGKTVEVDTTADISLCVLWRLNVLPIDDVRVQSTMKQLDELLTVQTDIGGKARYQSDYYHAVNDHTPEVTGNPWILTTLWFAEWQIRNAKTKEELCKVQDTFDWVCKHATPSGLLAEQLDPNTGEHLSVSPLTWSHATYVDTILKYLERFAELSK